MIDQFSNENHFLSNFYQCKVSYADIEFDSVEHAYQAAKAQDYNDMIHIQQCSTPGKAKRLGQTIKMRPDWEKIKIGIMYSLVKMKFKDNSSLKAKLFATNDQELIEGNWWNDTFWGVCKGKGENNLGKILMTVRNELRDEED